jgi:Tol biopolymer transport system component
MTATGGSVRRVVAVEPTLVQESLLHLRWVEGDRLIFGDTDENMRGDTYEFTLSDQSLRCITSSQPGGAYLGELSPSGEFLVFRRPLQGLDVDVFVLSIQNGDIHQISLPAREISWAPDGESLFLISTLEGNWDLWTVAIDSHSGEQKGEPRRLTTAVSLSDISFSPTGDRAVGSLSSSKSNLWIFPTNAGPVTNLDLGEQVTTGPSLKSGARWMPNGTNIVYAADRRGEMQIWTQETESGQPICLNDELGIFPIVSPDGRWIAYAAVGNEGDAFNTQIVRPDGSDLHPLYSDLPEEYQFIVSLDWSNDGRHIVYHTKIKDKDEWQLGVATINMETGTAIEIGLIGVTGKIPFWSPDGKHLVYQRTVDNMPNLYVSTVDGEKTWRLTDDPAQEWLAGWSENPSYVYYGRMKENGDKDVYRIAMDDDGRPKSAPELWMAFPESVRLSQFLDFHADRAIGAIDEAKSDICLIEFEKMASR